MKKLLRSTFGTLVLAAFLAVAPPICARGGHGGHQGGQRGHAVSHAGAGHVKGGHAGFRARGEGGHQFARPARGNARFAGRASNWNRGSNWGGSYWYPSNGYSRFGYYGSGYGYPYFGIGYYGYRSGGCYDPYYGYYPCGYYPYRYGYSPYVNFSFGY